MKRVRMFLLGLYFVTVAFSQIPCRGAVELTGRETTPPAPAQLDTNAFFSCKSNGNGLLTYPDGTHLNLLADSEGQILANGIRVKRGNMWVAYRKKGHYFAVTTPTAVIGIRGTDFGVSVSPNSLSVVLVNGKVTITPTQPAGPDVTLNPGQTFVMESGKSSTHPSTQAELGKWNQYIQETSDSSSQIPSFSDQYLFGMTTLESGSATVTVPGSNSTSGVTQGAIIRSGSNVKTAADSYARLSLLCDSKITLAPNSEARIGPLSLGIEKGSCMIRHTGRSYPLKVDGTTPVLIEKNSVVQLERTNDGLLLRVEVGEARHRGSQETITAGECAKVDAQGFSKVDRGPLPLSWEPSSASLFDDAADTDIFQGESSGQGPSDTVQQEPASAGTPEPSEQNVASTTGEVTNLRDMLGF